MSTVAEAITVYGVFPVFCSVMLILLIALFKATRKSSSEQQKMVDRQQKKNNEFQDQLMTIFQQICQNSNPRHTPEEEDRNRKMNLLINMQLQKIQLHTNANRVSCFLYHNGGKDILGRSFQKMSMTHEVVDGNTVSVMSSYQNIPRMMFPVLVQKLSNEGYYDVPDVRAIKDIDSITYQSLYTRGTQSAFFRAIRTTDHVTLGFVGVEFTTNNYGDMQDLKECLSNKAIKISGALEIEDDSSFLRKEGE